MSLELALAVTLHNNSALESVGAITYLAIQNITEPRVCALLCQIQRIKRDSMRCGLFTWGSSSKKRRKTRELNYIIDLSQFFEVL